LYFVLSHLIVLGVCARKIGSILAAAWNGVITDKVNSPLLFDACLFMILRIVLLQLGVSYEREFCNIMPMWIFLLHVFRTSCKLGQDYL